MSERTVGWWEVTIENEGPLRAAWWDGANWYWRKSELYLASNQDSIFPFRLLSADSPITPAPGEWELDSGEVVTLIPASKASTIFRTLLPLRFTDGVYDYGVTMDGLVTGIIEGTPLEGARLARPHVRKTPVERLRDLKSRVGNPVHEEIDGIIAELEKA